MQAHDDGSVTLTKREFALVRASWNEVTGVLDSFPTSMGDFLTTRGGNDTAYYRYQKVDTLLNGQEWPGIRQYLIADYGEEDAQDEFERYFDERMSDEEADALLDPASEEDDA